MPSLSRATGFRTVRGLSRLLTASLLTAVLGLVSLGFIGPAQLAWGADDAGVVAAQSDGSTPAGTVAPLANNPSPVTNEGSATNTSGTIVIGVIVVIIAGGALILYLRHRNKPA